MNSVPQFLAHATNLVSVALQIGNARVAADGVGEANIQAQREVSSSSDKGWQQAQTEKVWLFGCEYRKASEFIQETSEISDCVQSKERALQRAIA
jgi:hypothetical protein